jgi:membrane-bound ClpP family serine protease
LFALLWAVAVPAQQPPVPAAPSVLTAKNIAIIPIRGEIDGNSMGRSHMEASVRRRIDTAARAGADAIVFDIDTPGGEVGAVLRISEHIKKSPVPRTIAWIHPNAFSGGAIIAMACTEIITDDPARFGDAMPVGIGLGGMVEIPDEILKKQLPPLVSDILDSARRVNQNCNCYARDEYLAQSIVANDVELWWVRNKTTGQRLAIDRTEFQMLFPGARTDGLTRLAGTGASRAATASGTPAANVPGVPVGSGKLAGIAADVASRVTTPSTRPAIGVKDAGQWELIDKITDGSAAATFSADDLAHYGLAGNVSVAGDGTIRARRISTDEELTAYLGASSVRRLERSWSERFTYLLTHPLAKGLLIAIFVIALFVEMSHPGATLPGVIATLALALLVVPSMMVGLASWLEIGAILVGVVLIGVEIFVVPGFGVIGVAGIVLLLLGMLGTFMPSGSGLFPGDARGQSSLIWGASSMLAAFVTAGVSIYFIAKHFGSIPLFNKLVLKDVDAEDVADASVLGVSQEAPAVVGDVGVTVTKMTPAGRIELFVGGAAGRDASNPGPVIDAVSEFGILPIGTKVRVVSVDGIRVGVERVS